MAGKPGRSGGKREGAGRKPKEPDVVAIADPLEFLKGVWQGNINANAGQIRAAQAALPFVHKKLGATTKKELADANKKPSRFARREPPKLAAVGGKSV